MSIASPSTPAGGDLRYVYKPSVFGAAWEFALLPAGLWWQAGRRSGTVDLQTVRRVRMTYRPVTMQSHRFLAEIWPEGGAKLSIVSTSWKNPVQQDRQDAGYVAFIAELHRRLAQNGHPIYFQRGVNAVLYGLGLAAFAGIFLSLIVLMIRALQEGIWAGTAFIAIFIGIFLWQTAQFFWRNRPGRYSPDALPAELMPNV